MSTHLRPEEIEAESFRLIEAEVGPHSWSFEEWQVVRRAIHTSADFEYSKNLFFSAAAVVRGVAALRRGLGIVTDTNMALAGINRARRERFGNRISCFVAAEVARAAQAEGVTRSILAMGKGAADPPTASSSSAMPPPLFSNCCAWCGKKISNRHWSSACRSVSSAPLKARKLSLLWRMITRKFHSLPTGGARVGPMWRRQWSTLC